MENYIGTRAKIGVIIPATNTGVEYDLAKFNLDGVTFHPSRFWVELRDWQAEADKGKPINNVFEDFLELIRPEIPISIRNVMSAKVDHIMLGMSAETFWGGLEGNIQFEKSINDQLGGLGLTTGATAVRMALENFKAKTLSVVTPYPPVGDDNVRRFFGDIGFQVKHVHGLCRPSATAIAETPISMVMDAVRKIDGDDVDAIVQVGTNLSTSDVFPTLEHWLKKPCIPINVATVWHALRATGIKDKVTGKGRLMEEF
jgi:maleate isomerase